MGKRGKKESWAEKRSKMVSQQRADGRSRAASFDEKWEGLTLLVEGGNAGGSGRKSRGNFFR